MPIAKDDAAISRHAGVTLDHAVLHFDGAAHGVDDAAELDNAAVAGALDDAPVMGGDGGVDQIAAQPPKPRQGAVLVRAGEPTVADDVGDQDRAFPATRLCAEFPDHPGPAWSANDAEIESAGFRQGGLRLFGFAFERVGDGESDVRYVVNEAGVDRFMVLLGGIVEMAKPKVRKAKFRMSQTDHRITRA